MKIKTAWLSEMRGALGRPFLGGMNCFRTDKYGNIVGLKSPSEPRVPSKKQPLYRHQLRYWSLHWNFLTTEEKNSYAELGKKNNITGYNYYIAEKYDVNNLYMAPTDNRWVELWHPDTNPRAEEGLHISNDEEFEDWIYINFPLEKLSKNLEVTKAELWLLYYEEAGWSGTGKRINCHQILQPWSENTITYNNRPYHYPLYTTWSLMPEDGHWFSLNVTNDIQNIISSGILGFGWMLKYQETVTEQESMSGLRSTYPHDNDYWPYLKLEL